MKKMTVRFAVTALMVFVTAQSVSAARLLIPVGQVIGLEVRENQVTIAGFDSQLGEAAREAGLLEGDRITVYGTALGDWSIIDAEAGALFYPCVEMFFVELIPAS